MNMQQQALGLPAWPSISISEETAVCCVHGKHLSYRRFLVARILMRVAFAFYILLLMALATPAALADKDDLAVAVPVFLGLPVLFLYQRRLTSIYFGRFLIPKHTRVIFEREEIVINGERFPRIPNIQFRSSRPDLTDLKYEDIQRRAADPKDRSDARLKLRFRRLEMVYGLQLITVASIEDQDRADQFSVALTYANSYVFQSQPQTASSRSVSAHFAAAEEEGLLE